MLSPRPASSFRSHPTIPFAVPDLEDVLLTPHDGVLLTGSFIAGLANEASDFDLYIITLATEAGELGERPVAFYAEDNRHYFDAEVLPLQDVLHSIARIPFDSPSADKRVARLSQKDFVTSFRLASGEPIANKALCSWVMSQINVDDLVAVYSRWALLNYAIELAKARVLYHGGLGAASQATTERAVLFFSEAGAAALGDGYPSLKFTFDKLKRSAGEDHVLFERCWRLKSRGTWTPLEYLQRVEDLAELIPGARIFDYLGSAIRLDPSAEVISVLDKRYLMVHNFGAVPVSTDGWKGDQIFSKKSIGDAIDSVYRGDKKSAFADFAFLIDRGFATMEYPWIEETEGEYAVQP